MIKAFIFDMDGVIIDSEPIHLEVDIETFKLLKIDIEREKLGNYVGMTNPEMWNLIKQEYSLSKAVDEIINYQLIRKLAIVDEINIEPISGIRELIKEIYELNIPIALASSSSRTFIEKILMKLNIINYFSCIVSGEEVGKGKPAPDVYLETARLLDTKPENCLVLEDSKNGIAAAKIAGMNCIGFKNPNSGNQDLSEADLVVSTIEEINIKNLLEEYSKMSNSFT